MQHFGKATTVRLRSCHKSYLAVDPDDDDSVKQDKTGASRTARWSVEPVPNSPDHIRLKCSHGRYLTASDKRFLLGVTGHKVLLTLPSLLDRPDPSIDWRPLKDGSRVKLQSGLGTFLRANGLFKPYKGSVTHDVPHRTLTQDWVLWEVNVLEIRAPPPQHSPSPPQENGSVRLEHHHSESRSASFSVVVSDGDGAEPVESMSPSCEESESDHESSEASPMPPVNHNLWRRASMAEGRTIEYYMLDDEGEVDEGNGGSFTFKGSSVEDLTRIVEEMTGLRDVIICIRDVINDRLLRLRLSLPPNRRALTIIVVPSSSPVAMSLDI